MLIAAAAAVAQPTVAPTNEPLGRARGEDRGGYNFVASFETGYRYHSVDGDMGQYRSIVNFGNGIRLLGSNLTIHSREGHGRFFDEIVLTTQGLGNDPYQYSNFRIQKNRLYRYDLTWRLNEYYNPAVTISYGQHLMDTRRRFQDHDLIFFPQSSVRFFLGYSRNSQTGPALTTVQHFGAHEDEFPIFAGVRRQRNEYRLGGELPIFGARFHWLRGWDNFKEDTPYSLDGTEPGNNPADRIALNSFSRAEPYHGNTPYWRLALTRDRGRHFGIGARYTYASGRRHFTLEEFAAGPDRLGVNRTREILVTGAGARAVSAGSLTLNVFPAESVTITNHTAFHNTRMEGRNAYNELFSGFPIPIRTANFDLLGIRLITNATEITWRPVSWAMLFSGYQHSDREIRSREVVEGQAPALEATQTNKLNSGIIGVRLKPMPPVSLNLDAEIGRADRPFYPVSERNYHALGARAQYKSRTFLLSAATRTHYNTTPATIVAHSSKSRNYFFDASWTPGGWLSFDAGYSKLHLDTISGIAYFVRSQLTRDVSSYITNLHTANASVRVGIRNRVDLFGGYHYVRDRADGRTTPGADPFRAAQVFPLSYQSPLARISVRLHNKLRVNMGWQFYRYDERYASLADFRAHTGFASLAWSF
jgi:hypothetical protein